MAGVSKDKGRVLTIAGSDSGGGAGIQGDIKTISALGGYAMTAITALTAQDTRSIAGIVEIDPDFVVLQAAMCLEDPGVDAVKTGMLPSSGVITAIASLLRERAGGIPVVIDPVMSASSGASFSNDQSLAALTVELLPLSAIVTPNILEAEILTQLTVANVDQMIAAGRALCQMGAGAAFITGGHLEGPQISDVLVTPDTSEVFTAERIEAKNTHGTGCTLASALATELAFGTALPQAALKARDFVRSAIRDAGDLGKANGPLNHQFNVRRH